MADELITPLKPKRKRVSWWKKLLALIPILFLASWALAMWNPLEGGDNLPENLIKVGEYDFYELEDGTFGTYIYAGEEQIPIAFRLDPRLAGDISLEEGIVEAIIYSEKIYITSNPNQEEKGKFAVAGAEISRITSLYNIQTKGAYTEDANPINPSVPLRTCDDATDLVTVIQLDLGDDTSIWAKDNCVHVVGETADDLILAADKLGMHLVGINI